MNNVSEDTMRVATAVYAALNNGRIPSRDFFTTPATGGEAYVAAAVAAAVTIESIRSETDAPKKKDAPASPPRRENWHYDSKGYCDNPGRGY